MLVLSALLGGFGLEGVGFDESWFCGFAPADAPTIVACAIIEHGGQGAYAAAPAVRDIMASYFHVKPGAKLSEARDEFKHW